MTRTAEAGKHTALLKALPNLPTPEVSVIAEADGVTWVGTTRGAVRFSDGLRTREYFAGRRWLPDDRVTGIALEGAAAWIETPGGVAKIDYVPMTLAEKSAAFVKRVQDRHLRWGLTADSQLDVPGDLSTNRTRSTDNDGLWTAMYRRGRVVPFQGDRCRRRARQCQRAACRRSCASKRSPACPGFPARSFIKPGVDIQPADGEWHDTPDKQWRWKGDTSSDEIVGHYFVYPIYYDLVAADDEKPALRGVIDRITNHILDHGYQLVDVDGKRTRWGWWAPDLIWDDPDELGLRALHILSHLRVALHMTANPQYRQKYQAAYDELITRHRYHLLTRNQKIMVPGHINHSDDELAFLSFYPLLRYERDPALLAIYKESLERSWQIERPERNPLWNVIYAAGTGAGEFDRQETLRTLREIPMDMVRVDRDQLPAVRCADRSVERPVQAAPGAGRPALRRAADVEVERQSVQPRWRQRRPQRGRRELFPAAVLDGAVSRGH